MKSSKFVWQEISSLRVSRAVLVGQSFCRSWRGRYHRLISPSSWRITEGDIAGVLYPWVLAFAMFTGLGTVTKTDVQDAVTAAWSVLALIALFGYMIVTKAFQVSYSWRTFR